MKNRIIGWIIIQTSDESSPLVFFRKHKWSKAWKKKKHKKQTHLLCTPKRRSWWTFRCRKTCSWSTWSYSLKKTWVSLPWCTCYMKPLSSFSSLQDFRALLAHWNWTICHDPRMQIGLPHMELSNSEMIYFSPFLFMWSNKSFKSSTLTLATCVYCWCATLLYIAPP